jgi:transketolase
MVLNKDLRRRIVEKGSEIGSTHFASSFSCLDAIKYLYDNVLGEEDVFILSKGHGDLALVSVLESKGYNPGWGVHLEINEKEGIYATTGSLGHGFPQGVGRAHAKHIMGQEGRVYILTGDGEMEEGSIYESLALAKRLNLNNIVLMIDWNKYQVLEKVQDVGDINDKTLAARLKAFGWNPLLINGHDEGSLHSLGTLPLGLNAVILDTVKGNGLRCLENGVHGFKFTEEQYRNSLKELTD